MTPWLLILTTRFNGDIVGMGGAEDLRYRPDVDVVGTVVGDNSPSLSQGYEGEDGKDGSKHDVRDVQRES